MNIDKKKLGKRIKEIRVAEKDTLEAFANKINKYSDDIIKSGKSNVSRWEKGENIPNDITLKAIADIANITVDELLYGDKESRKIQIGFRIRNIRQTNGLTLEEFGKLFGATKGNVSTWEKGTSLPNNERIKNIAEYGNMSVEELLYGGKTISNSELELIKKLTKENEQLKDEIKDLKEIIETIKSIVLSKGG